MKKSKFLMLACAAVLAGCSSEDDALSSAQGSVSETSEVTTLVVSQSGVSEIPLVAQKGTTSVTVEYSSNGALTTMSVPFETTSTQANSSLVSGKITLYSATSTLINVYNGNEKIGENILLPGFVTTKRTTTTTRTGMPGWGPSGQGGYKSGQDEKVGDNDAYYYVRLDDEVAHELGSAGQASSNYYPQTNTGGTYFGSLNKGRISTSAVSTWQSGTDGVKLYIYSSDGSGTADALAEIPDFFGNKTSIFPAAIASGLNADDYHIIWYTVKLQDGTWHVDGMLTKKSKTDINPEPVTPEPEDTIKPGPDPTPEPVDTIVPGPDQPDEPGDTVKTADAIYHNAGVMMYDKDGDKDYNDLVIDYDVEARFPKDESSFPYIKINMHLRAMSNVCDLEKVGMNFKDLASYVCPADDMYITIHGVNVKDLDATVPESIKNTELKPNVTISGDVIASLENLGWVLTNNTEGWYTLDEHGCYNLTQETFNGKPFATLSIMLYPKSGSSVADIEKAVASVLDVAKQSFTFDGAEGDYIIAPVGTPHVSEPYTFEQAFPKYPAEGWWTYDETVQNYDAEKVVNINN